MFSDYSKSWCEVIFRSYVGFLSPGRPAPFAEQKGAIRIDS